MQPYHEQLRTPQTASAARPAWLAEQPQPAQPPSGSVSLPPCLLPEPGSPGSTCPACPAGSQPGPLAVRPPQHAGSAALPVQGQYSIKLRLSLSFADVFGTHASSTAGLLAMPLRSLATSPNDIIEGIVEH